MLKRSLFIAVPVFIFVFFILLLQKCKNLPSSGEVNTEKITVIEKGGRYHDFSITSQARGFVDLNVYLPPGWSDKGSDTYPLLIFLHGGGGDHYLFSKSVPVSQLNHWIDQNEIPPLVIVSPKGWYPGEEEQWYSPANQIFLTSESSFELRRFCQKQFRAGVEGGTISIQGFSRGASGALYFAFKYSDIFASAVANSFVSLYILEAIKDLATNFCQSIVANDLYLRIIIGDQDRFITELGWNVTPVLHGHLQMLGISHDYDIFFSVDHNFPKIWNYILNNGMKNGLYELRCHAQAWAKKRISVY